MGFARGLVEFSVHALIAVLLLRTCLVEVCAVTTGSMAPTILGLHRHLTCADCGMDFDCEAATFEPGDRAVCPNCGFSVNDPAPAPEAAGDRVLVDKTAFRLRAPRRWEPVVFRSPQAASTLYVKRVVGLPGESVQVIAGDIHINGQIARKTLEQQCATAILVHDADHTPQSRLPPRWQSMGDNGPWRSVNGRFHYDFSSAGNAGDSPTPTTDHQPPTTLPTDFSWLIYSHWRRGLTGVIPDCITDDCNYDQSTLRVDEDVSPVVDLLLSCTIQSSGDGLIALWATNGGDEFLVKITPQTGQVELLHNGRLVRSGKARGPMFVSPSQLELSLFDRQVLLAVDGELILEPYPFQPAEASLASPPSPDTPREGRGEGLPPFSFTDNLSPRLAPTSHPFAIGARELGVELSQLRIYRDVFYTRPLGLRRTWGIARPYQLSGDEYFVLGDNSPFSEDSRLWTGGPGVKRNLLIGKPFVAQGSQPMLDWGGGFQIPALGWVRFLR